MTPQGRPFTMDEALALHLVVPDLRLVPVPNTSPTKWQPAGELTVRELRLIHRVPSLRGWGVLKVAGMDMAKEQG